jgi:hypothetical protein
VLRDFRLEARGTLAPSWEQHFVETLGGQCLSYVAGASVAHPTHVGCLRLETEVQDRGTLAMVTQHRPVRPRAIVSPLLSDSVQEKNL